MLGSAEIFNLSHSTALRAVYFLQCHLCISAFITLHVEALEDEEKERWRCRFWWVLGLKETCLFSHLTEADLRSALECDHMTV